MSSPAPESRLSQDEIDALLDGVPADEPGTAAWPTRDAAQDSGIGAVAGSFDLATAERFGNGHLPTLALINERFVELLDVALYRFTGRHTVTTAGAATVTKYGAFIDALSTPSSLNIVHMGPSCGNALFVFDANLLFFVIDSLFGGNGSMPATKSGRHFTTTEMRLINRLCDMVFTGYAKAWEPVHPMQFELRRSESETRFVNLAGLDDAVLAFGFKITSGTMVGEFRICMPLAGIDPIRDLIRRDVREKTQVADAQWSKRLAEQVSAAEVELVAVLASVPVTCKELIEMKIGDVIVLDIKPTIVVSADGIPVLRCRYGNAEGRYAIRVEEVIAPSMAT